LVGTPQHPERAMKTHNPSRRCAANAAALALGTVFLGLQQARAESTYITAPSGAVTANARLTFSVNVERFLYLRVGTATAMANNTTVDPVNFVVPFGSNGTGTPIAGSTPVVAQVRGNGGNIVFLNFTPGSMSNGTQTVSYATVSATAAALAGSPTVLNHPAFVNGGISAVATLASVANVVDAGATWSFKYANAAVLNSGVYGATVARNARVTYIAVIP
jgi:hypothetical protein